LPQNQAKTQVIPEISGIPSCGEENERSGETGMMDRIAIFGLWLSGISFALFALSLLLHLFRRAPSRGGVGAGDVAPYGAAADLGRIFEAFSKLADSLNHSSPVVLTLMASIIFFALSLLCAGLGATKQREDNHDEDKRSKVLTESQACIFASFDTGKHEFSKAVIDQRSQDSEG
jgi:hypothetical protein